MGDVLYPQQKENFQRLKSDQHISQTELKDIAEVRTDVTVSDWCNGKKQIRRENAAKIVERFPEYTIEFLRGETRYKNKAEERAHIIASTINKGREEGTKLRAAFLILANLAGFTIDTDAFDITGDKLVDIVHEYTYGCDIIRDGRLLHLSMDDMSALENYVCDFVEMTLEGLLKAKGTERKDG